MPYEKSTYVKGLGGFTLIELIIVMLILGVLAATALPRFINVTNQAHETVVWGTGGALGSSVALVHAQWMANNSTAAVDNLTGFGADDVDTNADGWPVSTNGRNGNPNANRCLQVWNGVLQNPPRAATATASDPDYLVTAAAGVCTYTYQRAPSMSITYDPSGGDVRVDSSTP